MTRICLTVSDTSPGEEWASVHTGIHTGTIHTGTGATQASFPSSRPMNPLAVRRIELSPMRAGQLQSDVAAGKEG